MMIKDDNAQIYAGKGIVYESKKKRHVPKETVKPVVPDTPLKPVLEDSKSENHDGDGGASDWESNVKDAWDETTSEEDEVETEDSKPAQESTPADKEAEAAEKDVAEEPLASSAKKEVEQVEQEEFRSPICCVLGHVDTGKTKILDNIRKSKVQEGEAGGITQQIGATFIPVSALLDRIAPLTKGSNIKAQIKVPGLLVIDTPGHESFANLRARGSSMCDIAILVVDIMHGLENQTRESIKLLKSKKIPFVIALNKVDALYSWKSNKHLPMKQNIKEQSPAVQHDFKDRLNRAVLQLNQEGLNASLYYENKDIKTFVNIVPTSAVTGEGVPDLMLLLTQLTQRMLANKITLKRDEVVCTVMEIKILPGLGTTIDVILTQGVLNEGDKIILAGSDGPIETSVKQMLMPEPLKELRVKNEYKTYKSIKAANGFKILAKEADNAVAGARLCVYHTEEERLKYRELVVKDLEDALSGIKIVESGVSVQASTLGSLEALLCFLKDSKIPVAAVNIGNVHKKDVFKCTTQIKKNNDRFAVILAFDVKVEREVEQLAKKEGVKIFTADIIYHLFDMFTAHNKAYLEAKRKANEAKAIFPVKMRILPEHVFMKRNPIVLGVEIIEGTLRVGTPIIALHHSSGVHVDVGSVSSIEINEKAVETAKKGSSCCIKIEHTQAATHIAENQNLMTGKSTSTDSSTVGARAYGRHFDHRDELYSRISRESITCLKEWFKDEMSREDWKLVIRLKTMYDII